MRLRVKAKRFGALDLALRCSGLEVVERLGSRALAFVWSPKNSVVYIYNTLSTLCKSKNHLLKRLEIQERPMKLALYHKLVSPLKALTSAVIQHLHSLLTGEELVRYTGIGQVHGQ